MWVRSHLGVLRLGAGNGEPAPVWRASSMTDLAFPWSEDRSRAQTASELFASTAPAGLERLNIDSIPPRDDFLWTESPGSPRPREPPQTARAVLQGGMYEMPFSTRRPATTTRVPHRLQPLDSPRLPPPATPSTKSQSPRWWDMPRNVARECDRFDRRHADLSQRASAHLTRVDDDITSETADWYFRRSAEAAQRTISMRAQLPSPPRPSPRPLPTPSKLTNKGRPVAFYALIVCPQIGVRGAQ